MCLPVPSYSIACSAKMINFVVQKVCSEIKPHKTGCFQQGLVW